MSDPLQLSEFDWYDPINKVANIRRKRSYYIGYYSVVQGIVLNVNDGTEYDNFKKCLNIVPEKNEDFIIRKNEDFTETILFKWNGKYSIWRNYTRS